MDSSDDVEVQLPGQMAFPFEATRIAKPTAELVRGRFNIFSLSPPDDSSEGGGFLYKDSPNIFMGRTGYGPLRMAWDTNILIDYAEFGHRMWEDAVFDLKIGERRYEDELIALNEIMSLWTIRDIRIRMPERQIIDAGRRDDEQTWLLRERQIREFSTALSCISLDVEIDNTSSSFDTLPETASNDDWDQSLVCEAIETGCHVFLTRDYRLRRKLRGVEQQGIAIRSPANLLDDLAASGELSFSRAGAYVIPDTHKWTHIMGAHSQGIGR